MGCRVLVTGGAGFIGSHLVDSLMQDSDCDVVVLDDLSSGDLSNLIRWEDEPRLKFILCDLKKSDSIRKSLDETELVYHFAANAEVRVGEENPKIHFDENILATFNLLEEMRKSKKAKEIVFASSSTVYGEAVVLPTPEEYGPLMPMSTYGASKLSCEAIISAYAHTFGMKGLILRLANIIGARSKHGIVVDFIRKLSSDSRVLQVMGDGSQRKSYLHVSDCISAINRASDAFLKTNNRVGIYNVGSRNTVSADKIARIVAEEMGFSEIQFGFTGGVNGGRGWLGDVKHMEIAINKLRATGWMPRLNGEEAVRLATRELLTCLGRDFFHSN